MELFRLTAIHKYGKFICIKQKRKSQATVTPSVVVKLFVTVTHEFDNRLEQQLHLINVTLTDNLDC